MKIPEKRVFLASIATETNTFSPLRTDLQDFQDSFYAPPGEHPETPTLCSAVYTAARAVASQYNWDLFEGTACWAEPGGMLKQSTWEYLRDQLLRELAAAMPVDIVLLGLHGAMIAQDCQDCEGELLMHVRQQVGLDTLIGVTFDPHSHFSAQRHQYADIITVFKEFPHTDFVETAERLVNLAHRSSVNAVLPEISCFDCRMIEILPTSRQPMRGFVDRIKALEGQNGVLSISVIHGFMAGDSADLGTKVLVTTDQNPAYGAALARRLGMELYSFRGKTRPEFLTPAQALDQALSQNSDENCQQRITVDRRPVVIADVWDNPGGGVPGDSTIILRQMLDRKITQAALATIWDPIAVRTCMSAGIGANLQLRFGGKMSDRGGEPLDATVTVCNCVNQASQSFGRSQVPLGDAVWIDVNGIDVILNSVRSQVFSPDLFSNMGIQPEEKTLLVVKSTNHFYAAFSPLAAKVLYAAVSGPYPDNPQTNRYQHLTRKIWPRVANPFDTALDHSP